MYHIVIYSGSGIDQTDALSAYKMIEYIKENTIINHTIKYNYIQSFEEIGQNQILIIPNCDTYALQISINSETKNNLQNFIKNNGKIIAIGKAVQFMGERYADKTPKILNYKNLLDIIPESSYMVKHTDMMIERNTKLKVSMEYPSEEREILYEDEPMSIHFDDSARYIGGKFKTICSYNCSPLIIRNKNLLISCIRIDRKENLEKWHIEVVKFLLNNTI